MKVRSNRTHFMGSSNRNLNHSLTNNNNKISNIFQTSFNKSQSLLYNSMPHQNFNKQKVQSSRNKPFLGTNIELQSPRYDKNNMRPYNYVEGRLPERLKPLRLADSLNREVQQIKQQFKNKNINMHKIKELKEAFIKNNKHVRHLQNYFKKFSNNGVIDTQSMRKIVKQYGFDVNQDEVQLIFRLSQKGNKSQTFHNYMNIDEFVQLMTRENIYYDTLKINKDKKQIKQAYNFEDHIFIILRNKFHKIKEAFMIYQQRNQKIGIKQYEYVMKKLELTDLVIDKKQRQKIFNNYSNEDGLFNVQKLICAITQQQNLNNDIKNKQIINEFNDQIQVKKQKQFQNSAKIRKFTLKNLSIHEYETQFIKARKVIQQLQKLRQKKKQLKQDEDLFKSIIQNNQTNRQQIIRHVQKIMKKEGISFHKDQYDAFGAYLNYDVNDNITHNNLNNQIFFKTENEANAQFQRRIRNQSPISSNNNMCFNVDVQLAYKSLQKIQQYQLNPETSQLFKYFDQNKDGFIQSSQFRQKLNHFHILSSNQIQNLTDFFQINKNGSINYHDFIVKINKKSLPINQLSKIPEIQIKNTKSYSDWSDISNKKNKNINKLSRQKNNLVYQKTNRFSAWPNNIRTTDLSLIQPPQNAPTYVSQLERFNQKIEDYAIKQKVKQISKAECRRQKIAQWNQIIQERIERNYQKQQKKQQIKNYSIRLSQQQFQLRNHQ